MDKPSSHIVYTTTDGNQYRDPLEAGNHELTTQIENFLEAYLGTSPTVSRFDLIDLLRGKRKELSTMLAFDYTPERVVLRAPETVAKTDPESGLFSQRYGRASLRVQESSISQVLNDGTPFPGDAGDGGMTDEELERALQVK